MFYLIARLAHGELQLSNIFHFFPVPRCLKQPKLNVLDYLDLFQPGILSTVFSLHFPSQYEGYHGPNETVLHPVLVEPGVLSKF